jgi:hypothetical protein
MMMPCAQRSACAAGSGAITETTDQVANRNATWVATPNLDVG